jgi:hypothetical protein
MQPDTVVPVGVQGVQAWDRYAYVNNNPARFNDPSGHCIDGATTLLCIAMAAGAIAGYAIQVGENRAKGMEWGAALTTDISGEKILAGALIAGGAIIGAAAVSVGLAAVGITAGAACADGDCTNEARGVATVASKAAESADDVGTPNYPPGTFSIRDWSGYPQGPAPQPSGPFRLLKGVEYEQARNVANQANRMMHGENSALDGLRIHEIQPVKFGGNPTDSANKIALSPSVHTLYTNWWNQVQRMIEQK